MVHPVAMGHPLVTPVAVVTHRAVVRKARGSAAGEAFANCLEFPAWNAGIHENRAARHFCPRAVAKLASAHADKSVRATRALCQSARVSR